MFRKKKKKDDDQKLEKKEGKTFKLLTGIIIGGAVGSVLGVTLSDKENRDMVKRKTRETWEKSRLLLGEVVGNKRKKKTIWHTLNRLLGSRDTEE